MNAETTSTAILVLEQLKTQQLPRGFPIISASTITLVIVYLLVAGSAAAAIVLIVLYGGTPPTDNGLAISRTSEHQSLAWFGSEKCGNISACLNSVL